MNPMNPLKLMKLKGTWETFQRQHPKIVPFLQAAAPALRTGTVLEIAVTAPEGQPLRYRMTVTAQDMELLSTLFEIAGERPTT